MSDIKRGQRVEVGYKGRSFDLIVIDPNGLGKGQPSVGFGFRMGEKYVGPDQTTLSRWLTKECVFQGDESSEIEWLELPSGKRFAVMQIEGLDGNTYKVIEISDWVDIAGDLLEHPGRTKKSLKGRLVKFLVWFATEGLYGKAYIALKGKNTAKDERAIERWIESRYKGTQVRKAYTDCLQAHGTSGQEYAFWTNYIYLGLFEMNAKTMKEKWALVAGDPSIARNYIKEDIGLKAVARCEQYVVEELEEGWWDGETTLKEAHDKAIDIVGSRLKR